LRSVRWCTLLLITFAAGCADAPASAPRSDRPAPTVARVQCDGDGSTKILTSTVQAQPDGVHIDVEVPPGSNIGFIVQNCCGFNAEDASFVVPIPPGPMPVACLIGAEQDPGDNSLYRDIRVVDLVGAYAPARLDCNDASGVGSGDAGPSAGSHPISAARALLTGLRRTDDLVHVGYVERRSEAVVAVRRDGKYVAALELEPSGNGWGWMGFENCPGSGVSY
jgi:hypothetical protein